MSTYTIEGGAIYTLDEHNSFYEKGRLVVDDGKITEIRRPEGAVRGEALDAGGCVVLPGLVNCHTHLFMTMLRGQSDDLELFPWLLELGPLIEQMDEADFRYATYLGSLEALRGGTTCLRECCRYGVRLAAETISEVGLRSLVGGMPPSDWFGESLPNDLKGLTAETRAILDEPEKYGGLANVFLGSHSTYNCSPSFLQEAKAYANELGVPFGIHLAETRVETETIFERHGKSPVAYLDSLGILDHQTIADHCVWFSEEDIAIFGARGTSAVHNPTANIKLWSGVAPIGRYLEQGIVVGLGTDSAASNNSLNMLHEMKFAMLLQRAFDRDPLARVTAERILRMATIDGARALGLADEIGSLEVGKKADLVIVHLPPECDASLDKIISYVVYGASPAEIEAVVVDGRVLYWQGEVRSVDEPALRREIGNHFKARWRELS